MPITLKSTGGGSVSIDVPSTGSTFTLTAPANNATIFTTDGGAITGNVAFTSNNISIGGQTISPAVGMRNRIINGNMAIDQRANGALIAAATISNGGYYTADRWAASATQSSKYTLQQVTDAPTGFTKSLKFTSSSAYSVVSSDYFGVMQLIEAGNLYDLDYGLSTAKSTSLSFWVKSSLTGTFGGCILNIYGRSYPFSYTIASANTWQYVTINNIVGDTNPLSALPSTPTLTGVYVYFSCGAGSSYLGTAGAWAASSYLGTTGQTSVVGVSGATWQITGVQFESGPVATPFEQRLLGQELALCKRYYWQMVSSTNQEIMVNGTAYQSNQWETVLTYPVEMRSVPSITFTGPSTWATRIGGISPSSALSYYYGDTTWAKSQILIYAVFSGLTQGQSNALSSKNPSIAAMYFNAEL